MTRSQYSAKVFRLNEITALIKDLKSLRSLGVAALLEKYKSTEFFADLNGRGFADKALIKYTAIRVQLLKELNAVVVIVEDSSEVIAKEEVVIVKDVEETPAAAPEGIIKKLLKRAKKKSKKK